MTDVKKPLLVTIPHSGELIPDETPWLRNLPETLLMFDVDRYVDRLYEPTINELQIPYVKCEVHRYALDLNRFAEDIDCDSVIGSENPSGKFPRGLHWSITTTREKLMPGPMSREAHAALLQKYFEPFHRQVKHELSCLRQAGAMVTYHLDLHSMPSLGTTEHLDPGEYRKDIVIGDREGRSATPDFLALVIESYKKAGFSIAYNWPYKGGRLTEAYGRPGEKQNTIQIELNRALYMDERSKRLIPKNFAQCQSRLAQALKDVVQGL